MAILAAIGAQVAQWLLTKLGAFLSVKYKALVAKWILRRKINNAKKEDHEKMRVIKEKVENAKTDQEILDAFNDMRSHF